MPTFRFRLPKHARKVQPSADARKALIETYTKVLRHVGATAEPEYLDIKNTPQRVARMLLEEVLASYRPEAYQRLLDTFTTFPVPGGDVGMVVESPIPFASTCAHHVLPFIGRAHVGYIPSDKIVGLSKIPRVVDFFSKKLQVQERLGNEIADFLTENLAPKGVIVVLEARHLCMEVRGVRKPDVYTRTAALRGVAFDQDVRDEFYRLLKL